MKKSLILGSGVAALAMAALPFAGVFADDITTVKDTLTVTVAETCAFGSTTSGTVNPSIATEKDNSYSASNQTPGALVNLGDTTLAIECNNTAGYKITPTMTSLTGTGGTDIAYSATEAAAASGTWSAAYSGTASGIFTSGTAVTGTSTMTDTYTIHYKVGLGTNQEATTYTGTATYVLAPNV